MVCLKRSLYTTGSIKPIVLRIPNDNKYMTIVPMLKYISKEIKGSDIYYACIKMKAKCTWYKTFGGLKKETRK